MKRKLFIPLFLGISICLITLGTAQVSKEEFTLYLYPGWNLVSVPLQGASVIEATCKPHQFAYTSGYIFELVKSCEGLSNCIEDKEGRAWKIINITDVINNAVRLEAGKGYFIYLASKGDCYIKFEGVPFRIDTDNPLSIEPIYKNYTIIGAPWVEGIRDNKYTTLGGVWFTSVIGSCEGNVSTRLHSFISGKHIIDNNLLRPGRAYIVLFRNQSKCVLQGSPVEVSESVLTTVNTSKLYLWPTYITRNRNGYIDSVLAVYMLDGLEEEKQIYVKCGFRDIATKKVIISGKYILNVTEGLHEHPGTAGYDVECEEGKCSLVLGLEFPRDFGKDQGTFRDGLYPIGCWLESERGQFYALSIAWLYVTSKEKCPEGAEIEASIVTDKDVYVEGEEDISVKYELWKIPSKMNHTAMCVVFNSKGKAVKKVSQEIKAMNCSEIEMEDKEDYCAKLEFNINRESTENRTGVYLVACGVPWVSKLEYGVCAVKVKPIVIAEKGSVDTDEPDFEGLRIEIGDKTNTAVVNVYDKNLMRLPYPDVNSYVMLAYKGENVNLTSIPMNCRELLGLGNYECRAKLQDDSKYGLKFSAVDKYGNIGVAEYICVKKDEEFECGRYGP